MKTPLSISITEKLKAVARQCGATFGEILTQFLIERAATRLVSDKFLHRHLVFKGGFVGLRVYGSTRFTTDLDAVSCASDLTQVMKIARQAMEQSKRSPKHVSTRDLRAGSRAPARA